MAAPNFANQNFDSDEEEDDDFNPVPVVASDDEADEDEKPRVRQRSPGPQRHKAQDSDDENGRELNGNSSSKDASSRNKREDGEDEELKDDEENDMNVNSGEDDEGEGEDLGDEDEEDEEDDEDEDDDEAISGRPRKRRKRGGLNQFFEEEAEVDEEDDGEDDEDDLVNDGFVADTHPDDLDQLPEGAERDDRRHRELDRRREIEASMDAEKTAQALKERYGRRTTTSQGAGSFIPQNLLMPSVDDPSIWGIKCKPGKEREIVFTIMNKLQERARGRNPMRIFSAFERGGGPMMGYIFVEARKKADVDDALNGILNVYPRTNPNLVPVKEMPDLLRVRKSQELVRDGYVRIKRGLYQGDLAMIQDVETNGLEVTVRLVPRLTYGMDDDEKNSPMMGVIGPDGKRKRPTSFGGPIAARPPQRLFSEAEAKKKHGKFLTPARGLTGKSWNYKNELYEDGFLIKDMKIQHLITQDVNPKLDEITKLTRIASDGTETLDLESLAHSLRNNTAEGSYMPGDEVEVYTGEQKGIIGKAEGVSGNIVSIKVSEGDLAGQIVEVPMKGLRKRFKEGDHVKVIGGSRYKDEVGMVLRIKDDRVTVLGDVSMTEITVFSKDLREATDSVGHMQGNKYQVHDLVQLDPATVACVIKVDRESMRVLDQNGSIRAILPSQVTNKIEPRKSAIATDRNGSEIRVGDVVREVSGESKTGTILHIYRSFLFVHNRTQIENSGVFTTRCTNVATLAAKGGRITNTGPDLTKMNPALLMKNGVNGSGAMAPPKNFGRDRTLGKTVTIRKGPYKGMLGIVKDTTDTTARVELHSKSKVINVEKDALSIKDPITGQSMDFRSFGGAGRGSAGASQTGFNSAGPSRVPAEWTGGRTPVLTGDGGRTPAWGATARTPAWSGASGSGTDSSRTPAWKPQPGSQTSYGGAGNMTSYGGPTYGGTSGGRTPAWSSSARTPYGQDHGFASNSGSSFDAFAAGSRTPAFGSSGATGSRTPAWGGAPTPGPAFDAPTPGRTHDDFPTPYGGAPTPAVSAPTPRYVEDAATPAPAKGANREPLKNNRFDAPTPRYDAPTPAASAPTPAPFGSGYGIDAPTPAAGTGDGPRYIDSDEE